MPSRDDVLGWLEDETADQSLTPLDCGFDPRVHGMVCALRRSETVKYEMRGEIRVARGTDDEIAREVVAAGYTIEWEKCRDCSSLFSVQGTRERWYLRRERHH